MILLDITQSFATIISSVISALIALLVVFIDKRREKVKSKNNKYDVYKSYANPIISSCEQLAWRLKEILEFKGIYLLPNAPKNDYFMYKFDSTVYRLCAVIGWIRASKKEQSYFECKKEENHIRIQNAIANFKIFLADGSHVEQSILKELISLFNIKQSINKFELMGAEIENIIFEFIHTNNTREVINLDEETQIKMIKKILNYICDKAKHSTIDEGVIREKRLSAINEISRYYCWIYRDWQSAIGDIMLIKINNANRRFDVIGFGEFQSKCRDNEWIKKVDTLFTSLDVSIDDRFDARVNQLKRLYCSCVDLIEVLKEDINKEETITEKNFNTLKVYQNELSKPSIF